MTEKENPRFSSVKIDSDLTQEFKESKLGEEIGSNPIFLGKNVFDETLLLKSSIDFKHPETGEMLSLSEAKRVAKEYFSLDDPEHFFYLETEMKSQVAAQNLIKWLGIPSPEASFKRIQDTPFIVMEYLEGASDEGFGNGLDINDVQDRSTLGKAALGKLITLAAGDRGQLLLHKGKIYLTEISIRKTPFVKTSHDLENYLLSNFLISEKNNQARQEQISFIKNSNEAVEIMSIIMQISEEEDLLKKIVGVDLDEETLEDYRQYLQLCLQVFNDIRTGSLNLN